MMSLNVNQSIQITFVAKIVEMAIALLSGIILGRLLTPEDFGIYSIAASLVAFGYLFRNFGIGQFIIRADSITDDELRAAFSISIGVSWAIALLVAVGAPFAGTLYGNPGVEVVLYFLALNFLILPFGAIADAVLRRNMAFDKLAVINIGSATCAFVVGIGSAYYGAAYLSIAWSGNAGTLATILLTLLFRPSGLPWFPGTRGISKMLSFGLKVGVADLINRGSDAVTELIIGKVHDFHNLGIYSRAYGTFMLFQYGFLEAIRPVVLPYLSQANRANEDLGAIYVKIVGLVSIFTLPFFAFLYMNASDVLLLLYGEQWGSSAPILRVLCFGGLLISISVFFDQLLVAIGRPGLALRYQSIVQGGRLIALLAFVKFSLELCAYAIVLSIVLRCFYALGISRRLFRLGWYSLLKETTPGLLCSSFVVVATASAISLSSDWVSVFARLSLATLAAGLTWTLFVVLTRHPLWLRLRNR